MRVPIDGADVRLRSSGADDHETAVLVDPGHGGVEATLHLRGAIERYWCVTLDPAVVISKIVPFADAPEAMTDPAIKVVFVVDA